MSGSFRRTLCYGEFRSCDKCVYVSLQHFVCAKCEKPFLGHRHYERKGLAYCETHYNQVHLPYITPVTMIQLYTRLPLTIIFWISALGKMSLITPNAITSYQSSSEALSSKWLACICISLITYTHHIFYESIIFDLIIFL